MESVYSGCVDCTTRASPHPVNAQKSRPNLSVILECHAQQAGRGEDLRGA